MVSIEKIKEFNARLSARQTDVQRTQTQLEIAEKDLATKLSALSAITGRDINESNVEQYYAEVSAELEKQLINGCEILDRVEGKTAAPEAAVQQFSQPMGYPAQTPVTNVAPAGYGAAPQVQQVQPVQMVSQAPPVQQVSPVSPVGGVPVNPYGGGVATPPVVGMPAGQQIPTIGNMDAQQGVDMNSFGIIKT